MLAVVRKLILCSVVFCMPCLSVMADTMVVKVPVLNVRQCPSTDCKIVKKLSKGDRVNVESIDKGWAEIEIDKYKTGYTISRSLRDSYFYLWYYVIGGVAIYLLLVYLFYQVKNKCPSCKKFGALKEVNRECIEKLKSNIKKTATTRYKNHTRTREYIVPATVYKYEVTKKCTTCGHIVKSIESEKLEN
ncbi:MAG: SH3 domain-containing protein [Alphaproteobacteria bacterium]|nr:SH3 domain-containing protein [Alphaproteobacteria bacterium]